MENDRELLQKLRSSDSAERRQAERELFLAFEPRVRALLSRIVGSGADLDDAVQEALVDVFRGLSRFEGRSALGTWIYRVALRRGWKCAARESALRKNRVDVQSLEAAVAVQNESSPLEARELAGRFESALLQLDVGQRSVLALTAIEELEPPEIARILGVPVGTVHSRLSRARAKLKTLLQID